MGVGYLVGELVPLLGTVLARLGPRLEGFKITTPNAQALAVLGGFTFVPPGACPVKHIYLCSCLHTLLGGQLKPVALIPGLSYNYCTTFSYTN